MSIYTIYRACIWLPIVVPVAVVLVTAAFGLPMAAGVVTEAFVYSLLWGGLPYAVLAAWATWWVGGRPEAQIRRLMFRAPLLMVAVFVPVALAMGLVVGALGLFAAVAGLGAVLILLLGYGYVALTVLLRHFIGPRVDETR